MTKTVLHILCAEGDIRLTWDSSNQAEVAEARAAVLDLKRQGFQFFLIDGSLAPDEVSAGQGTLNCRRVEAEALLPAEAPVEVAAPPETIGAPAPARPAAPIRTRPGSGMDRLQKAIEELKVDLAQPLLPGALEELAAKAQIKVPTAGAYLSTLRNLRGIDVRRKAAAEPEAAPTTTAVATRPLRGG